MSDPLPPYYLEGVPDSSPARFRVVRRADGHVMRADFDTIGEAGEYRDGLCAGHAPAYHPDSREDKVRRGFLSDG